MAETPGRPVRATLIGHSARLSGAELALVRTLDALDPAAAEVEVVLFEDGPLVDALCARGVRVDVLALSTSAAGVTRADLGTSGLGSVPAVLPVLRRLVVLLRERRPDVVVTTTMKAHVLGSLAARTARLPLVWHLHDRVADDYLPRPVVRILRAAARRLPAVVVANSQASAATLPGVRDVVVAYPGFAPAQATAAPRRAVPAGGPVVLLLGRISPTKGQLELVRATPRILERHPGVRVRLVGDPLFGADDYAAEVDATARRLGVAAHVVRVPATPEPSREIDLASVLVHASPVPEPFGQVVVEGMIRGVPVVATAAGGVTEILAADGPPPGAAGGGATSLGGLVPPGDVDRLAAAVCDVLDRPEQAVRRAALAHASAVERFPAARTAQVVTDAWRRAAGARAPRRPALRP
ncbi:glycosyltransferase family 4 protein [Isoptericola sp. NPDC055881]